MDRQKLINEIRSLQKTKSKFSLEDIETEIRKRKGRSYLLGRIHDHIK